MQIKKTVLGGKEMDVKLIYDPCRNSWNVIVNGEWYFEGDYESANDVYINCLEGDYEN